MYLPGQKPRNDQQSVYFQKISPEGLPEWEQNGRPLISSPCVPSAPEMVADGEGGWIAAWIDRSRDQNDVMAQRFDVAGLPQWASPGVPVCMADQEQSSLSAIPDGSGGVCLSWMDIRDPYRRAVYVQRVSGEGIPLWETDGIPVSEGTVHQTCPVLAGSNSGNLLIAWQLGIFPLQAPSIECQALNGKGESLIPGGSLKVSSLSPDMTYNAIAMDSDHVCIAWAERRNQDVPTLLAQRVSKLTGEVLWEVNGIAITDSTPTPRDPQLAPDGVGGVFLFWIEYDINVGTSLKVQRLAPDGTAMWAKNGIELSSKERNIWSYRVVPDDTGGVFVIYETLQTGETNRNGIYVKHLNSSGECPEGEILIFLGDFGNSSFDYQAISDGLGGFITAWINKLDAITSHLTAQRVAASGEIQWATSGVLVCDTTQTCWNVCLTSDGQGGTILAWWDFQNPSNPYGGIYAQRVDANGTVIWKPNGVPVCSSPAVPVGDTIKTVSDGALGAFISWTDQRDYSVTDNDIYFQHLSSSGNILLESSGVPVYNGLRLQELDSMIPDGNGGVFLTWTDDRNQSATGYDLYAQIVDASGTFKWTTEGLPVTTALKNQGTALAVPDGTGGAVVAWIDQRNDLGDLYAQRIRADGGLGVDPTPVPTPTETSTSSPSVTETPFPTLTETPTVTLSLTPTWDYDVVPDGRIDSKDLILLIEEFLDPSGEEEVWPLEGGDVFFGISDRWMDVSGPSPGIR